MKTFAALCILSSVAAAEPSATREYVVKAGDTCIGIATRELGDKTRLDELHRLNPQLGPTPHHLKAGQVLHLPVDVVDPDAHLTAQHGTVEVRRAGESAWGRADTGADLFRAWRVGSRDEASAQVTFADDSAISMRENTVVVIYGRTRAAAAVTPFRATLERGTLRSRLAELDGRTVAVETPSGTAALGAGSAVLDVDAKGLTKVSNHRGSAVALTAKGSRRPTKIATGFGSEVAVGKDPTPPKPLPPTPPWRAVPSLALGWAGQGAVVRASWEPVAAAVKYRVELARDRDLSAVDVRLELGKDATAVEALAVPPGDYWMSVASVDAGGFESIPAPVRAVHVTEVPLPAGVAPGMSPRVALGQPIAAPAGYQCAIGGASPAAQLVATGEGPQTMSCTGADGTSAPIAVDVAAVHLATWRGSLAFGSRETVPFEVTFDATVRPIGALVAHAPPGIAIVSTEPRVDGLGLVIGVRAEPGAKPGPYPIAIALAAQTGVEIPLGSVDLVVERAAVAAVPAHHRPDPRVGVSAFGGIASYDDSEHAGGRAGLAIAVESRGAIGLDVSATRGFTTHADVLFQAGISLSVPMFHYPSLRLGFTKWSDSRDPGGYAGVGMQVPLTDRVSAQAVLDAIDDTDGARLQASVGLRLWLW